jgi:hypothetical protein
MSREEQYRVADVYSGTNPVKISMLEQVRADMIRQLDLIDKGVRTENHLVPGVAVEPTPEA